MLLATCWLLAIAIVAFSIGQLAFAVLYARLVYSSRRYANEQPTIAFSKPFPKAAVVMSLRGSDPFLCENLSTILDLDYPDFKLFVIVDSEQDSAMQDAEQVRQSAPDRVEVMTLQRKLSTCSLKCSALSEAVEQLGPEYGVVAFIDGDVSPHRQWLRDLVQPLSDPAVGVSTGNRWYTPEVASWGAMVRYFWNTGAVVQVWLNGITWGGSMAMRRDTIDSTHILAEWRRSLVDDGAVVRQMRTYGYQVAFVPNAIMPNRENIRVASFITWSERQLVAAKSAASGWGVIILHALVISSCMIAPSIIFCLAVLLADKQFLIAGLFPLFTYWVSAVASTIAVEIGMQRSLRDNGIHSKWINGRVIWMYLPALVLSHLVYLRALVGACRIKKLSWRGIEYLLLDGHNVKMVRYIPFGGGDTPSDFRGLDSLL